MALTIDQDFEYAGDDYWKWSVWIDGPDAELEAIDHVVYTLHSSFPNPVREIDDRASNFRLSTAGWGTFRIYARVVGKDDAPDQHLEHDLDLRYPETDAPAPP